MNEAKKLKRWVCHKDKQPYNAKFKYKKASVTNPETWSDYKTATNNKYFSGYGFVLGDGYAGIDLDHCIDKQGNIADYAKEIINIMKSYTEISLSGTGIHILCKGTLPECKKKKEIEMYDRDRYFTVTENIYNGFDTIEERQTELNFIYQKYFGLDEIENNSVENNSDHEILEKIRKSQKYNNLFNGIHDRESQSNADQALITYLCRLSGDNEQVKRIFLQSELGQRDKAAKRKDYVMRSINKARDFLKQKEPAKEIEIKSILDYLPTFADERKTKKPTYKTGFEKLDKLLDGGLFPGLYIISAGTSIGKTTFMLQLADSLARQKHNVFYFSLEMNKSELISKTLSREMFKLDSANANTTRQIMRNEHTETQIDIYNKALEDFKTYADKLFICDSIGAFSVEQIKHDIETRAALKPVVIVDYLQILKKDSEDLRAGTDKNIIELKRLSNDLQIPILVISAIGRHSYNKELGLDAGKESGGIEYGADVVLGLQFSKIREIEKESKDKKKINFERIAEQEKAKETKEIDLKLLKNRHGTATGLIIFDFNSKYNYFHEKEYLQSVAELEENLEQAQKKKKDDLYKK